MALGLSAKSNNLLEAGPVVVTFVLRLRMQEIKTRKGFFVLLHISVAIGFSKCWISCFKSFMILSIFFTRAIVTKNFKLYHPFKILKISFPYFSSFAGPMPFTFLNSSIVLGLFSIISIIVLSCIITYAGRLYSLAS